MEKVIRRYIENTPEIVRGVLSLSAVRIERTVDPGETVEDSFVVASLNDHPIEGFVYVDEPRFRVLTPAFCGTEEEIGFSFRTDGLQGGDSVEGHFAVITDCGEETVTVAVSVRTPYPIIRDESGEEEMKNLFHFANLARRNYDEAARLFYTPGMQQLFHGADKKYRSIYRGLSGTDEQAADKGESVEEFLIAVRKKDPIEYSADRAELVLESVTEDVEEIVKINRRGWGYTRLDIETDGAFLELRRSALSDRDFLGSSCNLPLIIRYASLHAGRNFGRIVLYNAYTKLEIAVAVTRGDDVQGAVRREEKKEKQALEFSLIHTYVEYRLGRMRSREWLLATGKIVSRMNGMAPDDVRFQLYTAHYLITASRENEAIWVLDRIRTSVEETCSYGETMRAYFLYLETLISREEKKISAVEEILNGMLARRPDDWRIAWLLQFLLDDRASGNAKRMRLYEEQFLCGCRSPILYIETIDLMGRDPSLLKKIDSFTLYVLAFAARHRAIPKALIDRAVWLLMRERQGNDRIYRILESCYAEDPESGALDAICSMLIKDARTDAEAFGWYREGVRHDSRITRLYEYYMLSCPTPADDRDVPEIPRQVLLYFSYKSDLPFDKNALLYRYVIAHREEEPELYQSYLPQMERFVSEQMAKGRIDRSLNALYTHFCVLQPQDPVSAERLFEALHMTEFEVEDSHIRRIVVVYDRLNAERCYPVVGGKARFPLYGSEAAVLYEDDRGHRYARMKRQAPASRGSERTAQYLAKTMDPAMYAQVLPFLREGNANINLYLTEASRMTVTADNADRYRRLAESEALQKDARNEISHALIRFYYDNDFIRQLVDYLPVCHPERMRVRERAEVLEMMVHAGIYDQAFAMVERFGFGGVEERTAYRLCSRASARGEFPAGEAAGMLAYAAFRMGKYDEGILTQIVRTFTGRIRDEQAICKACAAFSVDPLPLVCRMLTQLLFTDSHEPGEDKLFRIVAKSGGSTELQIAWLARASGEYLIRDVPINSVMAERIRTLSLSGEELPASCRLAWLKFCASMAPGTADAQVTSDFLSRLTEAELGMPFLYAYRGSLPALALGDGMRYVQIAASPGLALTIHLAREAGGEFVPRRMKEPYPGCYTHGEVLFPGESARYYITARKQGKDRLIAGGMITFSLMEDPEEGESRFALTSRLIRARTQNDRAAVRDLLYALYRNTFMSDRLFPLPGEKE
ncbi:MAG: DUF5717 family protein [Lachnospiraceae bacterium]|nr:DUF5717 family protein [Lachnospiraceae bacterium]